MLETGNDGRPNAIRRVDTSSGAVTTFASGGPLGNSPTHIEVDSQGRVWVAVSLPSAGKGIVRYPAGGGTPTTVVSNIAGGYYGGTADVGDAFALDPSETYVYYSSQTGGSWGSWEPGLRRLALASLPATADSGDNLGTAGYFTRDGVPDMEFAPDGNLYLIWNGAGHNTYGYPPQLYRFDGPGSFTLIRGDYFTAQPRLAFGPSSTAAYFLCSQDTPGYGLDNGCRGSNLLVRRSGYGDGDPVTIAGSVNGWQDGALPGKLGATAGLAISADGHRMWIADRGNFQIREVVLPPDGPSDLELSCSCSEASPHVNAGMATSGNPVGTAFGNSHEDMVDLAVPTRGGQLSVRRSYNSLSASVDSPVGYGWSNNWSTHLAFDTYLPGDVSVVQPSGVPVVFSRTISGGNDAYTAGPWVNATLTGSGTDYVFRLVDGTAYTYSSAGRLSSVTTRQGYVTRFEYDGSGLLIKVLDRASGTAGDPESGISLSVAWDAAGTRISSIADAAGRTVTYGYDSNGNLTDATDGGGAHWRFGYDGAHRLTSIRHPDQTAANVTDQDVVNTYDGSGRVTVQSDHRVSPALVRQFDYTSIAGATRVIDPKGNVRVDYYSDGRRTKVVDGYGTPEAVTRTLGYDLATGAVSSVTVGEGTGAVTVAAYTYDAAGNVTASSDALGRTTRATYNSFGQPLTVTDPAGVVTTFSYDAAGNVTSQCTPLGIVPTGGTLSCGDVAADHRASTTWTYGDPDHPGDVTMVKSPTQQDADPANSTRITYAADGQVATSTDAVGNTTSYGYDNVGRLASVVSPRGNVSGATAADFTTVFDDLDGYGAPWTIHAPGTDVVHRGYDAEHRLVSETGADGHTTSYVHDGAGRLVETRQASDTASPSVSVQRWWPDGTLQETQDPAGNVTHCDYDHLGRLTAEIDPSGTRSYSYDTLGRMVAAQDPGGNCAATPKVGCTSFGYDAAGQLVSIDYSDPQTPDVTATSYDPDGRVTSRTSATGTTARVWDTLGRMTASTVNGDTTGYGYDLAGRTTSITYPGYPAPVTRTYDAAGRWVGVNDGTAGGGRTTGFGYDADSNLRTVTFPGSVNVDTYTLDTAGRPTAVTFDQGATRLGTLTWGRDGAGRVTSETVTTLTAASSTYGYNPLGQLDRVNSTTPNLGYDEARNLTTQPGQVQAFDTANRICWSATSGSGTCASAPAGATRYGFDTRGNRTSTEPDGAATASLAYDQANRLTSVAVEDMTGDQFTALSAAVKVLDTRASPTVGACPTSASQCVALNATNGQVREVQVAGVAGLPAAGQVEAVMVNIVATGTCASSCAGVVSVWPNDVAFPWTTNVNYTGTERVSNTAIVRLPADGRVKLYATDANVQVWVAGYFRTNDGHWDNAFEPVNPAYVAGTSSSPGSQFGVCSPDCGRFAGTGTSPDVKTIEVRGHGGVPTDTQVTAVAINVGIVNPGGDGNLLVGPSDNWPSQTIPYRTGQLGSNLLIVPVGADGRLGVWAWGGAVDVRLDVYGYFTGDPSATGGYHPLTTQATVMRGETGATPIGQCPDTTHPCSPLGAGQTITVQITGQGAIPTTNVDSVVVNLTATSANPGWIGVWADDGTPYPGNVTLYQPGTGKTVAGTATVKVGPTGRIKVFTWAATDLRIDAYGYFTPAAATTHYTYDNDGLRRTKTAADGTVTTYTWDTTNPLIPLLLTETTTGDTTRYIYGPGGIPVEQINPDGSVLYLHRDQLGSIRLLTNATGGNIGERAYTPYGTTALTTGTATPFGYAGQYTDTDTGYQYLRARYYDPTTAQFISRDPLVTMTGSTYSYASQNPMNSVDPTGLFCLGLDMGSYWCTDKWDIIHRYKTDFTTTDGTQYQFESKLRYGNRDFGYKHIDRRHPAVFYGALRQTLENPDSIDSPYQGGYTVRKCFTDSLTGETATYLVAVDTNEYGKGHNQGVVTAYWESPSRNPNYAPWWALASPSLRWDW